MKVQTKTDFQLTAAEIKEAVAQYVSKRLNINLDDSPMSYFHFTVGYASNDSLGTEVIGGDGSFLISE